MSPDFVIDLYSNLIDMDCTTELISYFGDWLNANEAKSAFITKVISSLMAICKKMVIPNNNLEVRCNDLDGQLHNSKWQLQESINTWQSQKRGLEGSGVRQGNCETH